MVSLFCQVYCWGRFHSWAADIVCVVSLLRRVNCCVRFIVWRVHCCVGFIVGAGFIVGPRSLFVPVYCSGESIVAWGTFLGLVSLLGRGNCWCSLIVSFVHCCVKLIVGAVFIVGPRTFFVVSLFVRVHSSVKFIVGTGFIVGPKSLLVFVQCRRGSIVAWGSLLLSVLFLRRGHCGC